MTTHYLLSQYNDEINDVATYTGTPTVITGNYVIRVPDEVAVSEPSSRADLLTKKYSGMLGSYGLYTQIAYDDMLDGTGVDTASSTGIISGYNGIVGLYPAHGAHVPVMQMLPYGIVWSGPGSGPSQALLTYELFEFVDTDEKDAPYQRAYSEVAPDIDVSVEVSFDNGANYLSTTDKSPISIAVPYQGNQVIVRFTRTTDVDTRGRVFLGSWAVLF